MMIIAELRINGKQVAYEGEPGGGGPLTPGANASVSYSYEIEEDE